MDTNRHEIVAGVADPRNGNGSPEGAVNDPRLQSPKFEKSLHNGDAASGIRVPFREITLAPTKSINGEIEGSAAKSPEILPNEPVRVYDTSGPWGDPDFHGDVTQGLPPLRAKWIRDRGDVEEIEGRKVQPIDDGYLSEKHAELERSRTVC